MKTTWNNRQGHRDRQAHCVLVTVDGNVHPFNGSPIPGVCHADITASEKAGKWSFVEFEITHADTTVVVQWMDDWETGRPFPQTTWEEGFFWLASQAPFLTREAFEGFIREAFPKTASRWDATKAAEAEFGFQATPEEMAAIKAAQERIAAEKAAYEAAEAERRRNSPFAALLKLKTAA